MSPQNAQSYQYEVKIKKTFQMDMFQISKTFWKILDFCTLVQFIWRCYEAQYLFSHNLSLETPCTCFSNMITQKERR